jgi:hypothetical protein
VSVNGSPPKLPEAAASTPVTTPAAVTSGTDVATAVAAPAAGTAAAPGTASGAASALPGEPAKVVDPAAADAADSTAIVAPEPAAPPKKTKRHASTRAAPFAGIGSFFRRAFASHGGRSYYPQ